MSFSLHCPQATTLSLKSLQSEDVFKCSTLLFQVDQSGVEEFNLTSDGEFNAVKSLVLGKVHGESESSSFE